ARAALARVAADVGAGQAEVFADQLDEEPLGRDLGGGLATVEGGGDRRHGPCCVSCVSIGGAQETPRAEDGQARGEPLSSWGGRGRRWGGPGGAGERRMVKPGASRDLGRVGGEPSDEGREKSGPDSAAVAALYRERVMTHARAPRNFGALEGATRRVEGHNPL